ncbi:unnamed protein product, partial [Mesorhabditis belari]|uniref:Uncharacterized protein n=1 Tax=Mesorhabditis belari TaxID=2138241 RepID=A0AAF3EME7_9BILA
MVFGFSIFTTPLAVFFAATNIDLSLPIRLLAAAENSNKFIYVFTLFSTLICDPTENLLNCSIYYDITKSAFEYIAMFGLYDIAQYCQFIISLSRFLAISFNGAFFRYTLKFPLLQLIIPYVLRFDEKKRQDDTRRIAADA